MFGMYRNRKKIEINWHDKEKELDKLIENYKNKNNYDCIIPFSGVKIQLFADDIFKKKKLKAPCSNI